MVKRASRVITFILILIISTPVSFGTQEDGHFLKGGQEVKSATQSCYYDKCTVKTQYEHEVYQKLNAQYSYFGNLESTSRVSNGSYYYKDGCIKLNYDPDTFNVSPGKMGTMIIDAARSNLMTGALFEVINPNEYIVNMYYFMHDKTDNQDYIELKVYRYTLGYTAGSKGDYLGVKWLDISEDTENQWDKGCLSMSEFYVPTGKTRQTANALVESNIIAPDGTYPNNGKHTDGYWYVKRSINSPAESEILSKMKGCTPSITVADPQGDPLTCKYYIDLVEKEQKTISNTATPQLVNFSALDISTLSDGNHTLKFEVSDGSASPMTMSVNVIVDNSPPVIGSINITADATSMSISGSATDTVSDAASIQYRYTVGSTVSNWVSNTPYTISSLTPNTVYYVECEARDNAGNISSVKKTIRTKAQTPQINFSNNKENSLDLSINDSNPAATQYQIMAGSRYVNASGILTSSPEWITVPGKKITVTGLTANTQYNFTIKAKNDEGIETAATQKTGTTLALPPKINIEKKWITYITLTWDAVNGATGYEIEADGKISSSGTATTYTQNELQAETLHTYRVRVINAGGTGPWSDIVQAATYPNPPEMPVITETYTTQSAITINWDAVDKATGYEIEADGKTINTGISTTYTDEGLNPDSIHKYRIRAINDGGSSEWSEFKEISTLPDPPEIPEDLVGKPAMKNITLIWKAAERAEGYELEVDGRIIQIETNTYIHEELSTNTTHKYRIRAYNKGGKSQWSEPVIVTTWPDIPSAPTNIMATAEQNSITLTWYSSPYAESYDVQTDEKDIVNIKGMSYTNESLNPGTEHSYRIRAVNISGSGEWSNSIEITTLPLEESSSTTGAAIIANLAAVVTNKTVTIAWQAVEANAQYDIEVDGAVMDNGKDTVYSHTGLKAETFHTYRVRTKNANGNGQWCAVLALSTLPDLPDAPSNVNVTVTDTQIKLTWTKEEGISYEVEADGEPVNVGQVSSYIDENLAPGTSHTYRVRGSNIAGVTAWSDSITKSTTSPSYELECTKGQKFDFSLLAANVQDFGDIKFVVTYDPDELEVVDLCEFTAGKDTAAGAIPGTNITVTVKEGRIEYKINESITPGTAWSGEISAIVFRAKADGKTSINYCIE